VVMPVTPTVTPSGYASFSRGPAVTALSCFRAVVSENVLGSDAIQFGVRACDCSRFVVSATE